MTHVTAAAVPENRTVGLIDRFIQIRNASVDLCTNLEPEDMVVQSMPDASPTKWHLAHITWFFENFVLVPHDPNYQVFDPEFGYLFNSYYYTVGSMYARPRRGLITRPTVKQVLAYREHVDAAVVELLQDRQDESLEFLVTLGLNHEQQHQELMLTDLKHLLFQNPKQPVFRNTVSPTISELGSLSWVSRGESICDIGYNGSEFCFDNETPRHRALVPAHRLANRPISNGEYREFIQAGGYNNSELWLSDGWSTVNNEAWTRPIYWHEDLDQEFTLGGLKELNLNAPVTHISYYEADAFARWAGARLPTEFEWEALAQQHPVTGNFAESGLLHPAPVQETKQESHSVTQLFGDVWEWTMSSYSPYPGFKPLAGSLGEYNGKFMCSQVILRGGSCVTPVTHIRDSYRNFFYPGARWQFSGIRLAGEAQ